MAIEITNFNYPTAPNSNREEVYDWLVANASEYFPGGISVVTSTGHIKCTVDQEGQSYISLPFTTSSTSNAVGQIKARYDLSAYTFVPHGDQYGQHSFSKAAKTSKGIAVLEERFGRGIFLSTTTSGNVCVAALLGGSSGNSGYARLYLSDLSGGQTLWSPSETATVLTPSVLSVTFGYLHSAGKTVIAPLVFKGGEHTENLFMAPVSQSQMTYGLEQVTIDGADYVYDGLFALKG